MLVGFKGIACGRKKCSAKQACYPARSHGLFYGLLLFRPENLSIVGLKF